MTRMTRMTRMRMKMGARLMMKRLTTMRMQKLLAAVARMKTKTAVQ
jgi:hypothetical protein